MELGGVHHVSINVSDNEAAAAFYMDTLGLEQLPRPGFDVPGTWLKSANGVEIHLIEIEDWKAPKGQHYAFAVADLDAAITEIRDKGIKIGDAIDIPGTGARQAFTFDPSGNMVEFNQSG
jgi:glyoxylase I family protein